MFSFISALQIVPPLRSDDACIISAEKKSLANTHDVRNSFVLLRHEGETFLGPMFLIVTAPQFKGCTGFLESTLFVFGVRKKAKVKLC